MKQGGQTRIGAIRFFGIPTDDLGNPVGADRGVQVPLGPAGHGRE